MPILPYCVVLANLNYKLPLTGIRESVVEQLQQGPLTVLYSDIEKPIPPTSFQQMALEFHRLVHSVFENGAVVPFRFPTWLTQIELATHLQEESQRYEAFLTEHRDHVQMELRITRPPDESSPLETSSGTEHLRMRAAHFRRLNSAVENLKQLLSADVVEWRERDTPEGMRLYALVGRHSVVNFRERLSRLEHGIRLRWSGPWPTTEFLEKR
jgi:hypothetical protein